MTIKLLVLLRAARCKMRHLACNLFPNCKSRSQMHVYAFRHSWNCTCVEVLWTIQVKHLCIYVANLLCTFKVFDKIQKNISQFSPWKLRFWNQKKSHYFSDYCSEMLGPKYVSFRCYEQKNIACFHNSVVTTQKVHRDINRTVLYIFAQLVWKPWSNLAQNLESILFGQWPALKCKENHTWKKSEHVPLNFVM